jgi:hypothetical protein
MLHIKHYFELKQTTRRLQLIYLMYIKVMNSQLLNYKQTHIYERNVYIYLKTGREIFLGKNPINFPTYRYPLTVFNVYSV